MTLTDFNTEDILLISGTHCTHLMAKERNSLCTQRERNQQRVLNAMHLKRQQRQTLQH
jgi:hypothetical protein